MQKCVKNAKNYQTLKKISSLVSLTRHFKKNHISGAATRHAPVHYAKYVVFFFFLSSHHDKNPLLHFIIFVKKIIIYWLILQVNHRGSYFPFFVFTQWVKHVCIPAKGGARGFKMFCQRGSGFFLLALWVCVCVCVGGGQVHYLSFRGKNKQPPSN